MLQLNLTALQDGYQVDMTPSSRQVELRGGLPSERADLGLSDYTVRVTWVVDNETQQALETFYRAVTLSGEKFLCSLVVEDFTVKTYVVEFAPGSLEFSEHEATQRLASAVLLVEPAAEPEEDEALLDIYEIYGEEAADVLNLLAQLVNEDLPS